MLDSAQEAPEKVDEVADVNEDLQKEIEIKELKESLGKDIKELLLKEIDVAEIKNILLSEIDVKDLFFDRRKSNRIAKNRVSSPKADLFSEEEELSENTDFPGIDKQALVKSLKEEHLEILFLYDRIMEKSREKSYTTLTVLIARLSTKCLYHFNTEEDIYRDMRNFTSSKSEFEKKVSAEFNQEMKDLSLSISSTLRHGNNLPVSDDTVDNFISEFSCMGKKLNKVIKREESVLFPMYENSR